MLFLALVVSGFSFAADTIVLNDKNTVVLNQKVNGSTVAKVQNKLYELADKTSNDLYLVLYTPGGSVTAGMQLIDTIKSLKNKVHTITIFAASMGYQIVQNADKRYILPSGNLMSHRPFISGLSGSFPGELNTRLAFYEKMTKLLDIQAAKRVGISLKDYQALIHNEYWVTGSNAVIDKHADEVILARCDKSLSGTYFEVIRTFFGAYNVEFSKCPLITGILSVKSMRGVPVSNPKVIQRLKLLLKADNIENIGMTL